MFRYSEKAKKFEKKTPSLFAGSIARCSPLDSLAACNKIFEFSDILRRAQKVEKKLPSPDSNLFTFFRFFKHLDGARDTFNVLDKVTWWHF